MSKPSENPWPSRFARICWALIAGIVLSYLAFAIGILLGNGVDWTEPENTSLLDQTAIYTSFVGQLLCVPLFVAAFVGIISGIRQKPAQHTKTFIFSFILCLSPIPIGIIFLSNYGV